MAELVGSKNHSIWSVVVPYGIDRPSAETEVTLPASRLTVLVAGAKAPMAVFEPRVSAPRGVRTTPPWTILAAWTVSDPPAE